MKNKVKKYIVDLLKKNRKQKGFTMIEMVIVVAIIAILIMLIAPNLLHQKENASKKSDEAFRTTLETQLQLYKQENDDNDKKVNITFDNMKKEGYLTENQLAKATKGYIIKDNKVSSITSTENEE